MLTVVGMSQKKKHYGITKKKDWVAYKKAENLIQKHSYYNAIDLLKSLSDSSQTIDQVQYKLGSAYLLARDYKNAATHLKQVANNQERLAVLPMSIYEYAQSLHMQGKYNQAKTQYLRFMRLKNKNKPIKIQKKICRKLIASCDWALEELDKDANYVTIENVKGDINHAYTDFSPVIINDKHLLFASLRADTVLTVGADYEPSYTVNLYESTKEEGEWSEPTKLPYANASFQNTANGAYNLDSSKFYFSKCFFNREHEMQCHLYYSERVADGYYTGSHKIHGGINTASSSSTQPAFQKAVAGRGKRRHDVTVMYFVSDRPGGLGGKDIWYSIIDNDKYSTPINCKRINTPLDEVSPYYDNTNMTMYYSSQLQKGFGGFDIIKAKGRLKSWRERINMGQPYNTSYDDTYFVPSLDSSETKQGHGFLVSNRPGGHALKSETCCDDIYSYLEYEPEHVIMDGIVTEFYTVPDTSYTYKIDSSVFEMVNKEKVYAIDTTVTITEIEKTDSLENVKIGYVQKRFTDSWEEGDYSAFEDKITWNDSLNKGDYKFDLIKEKEYLMVVQKDSGRATLYNLDSVIKTQPSKDYITHNIKTEVEKREKPVLDTVSVTAEDPKELSLDLTKKDLKETKTFLLKDMYYDVNKDQLQDRSKPSLELLLAFMEANPSVKIEIAGHTDSDGSEEYNEELSQRRAETVLKFLVKNGITESRLSAKGYGEAKPIATNQTVAGRQKNRRTEITIL